ncbi:hypothetical protein ACEP6V_20850 [Pseudomonas aeruginosa]|jgi:hypothetical protein|uniref:hypothetical protein n=1 Tax=Pseudomonas aeruginosa TaxID=287 RepID=UPI000B5A542A|nr:hypothetical protein [Pseudomonas aeruginosa]ELN4741066.1 hypothetical protein [Escherichia coli]ASJ88825.1 hypothetical protein PSA83_06699 [Pseudomonas aeruginosa]MBO8337161.1 hypothetical protein [Pseudomonas aeruginosa]MCV6455324.1 hypothetical protein [Pseudomonas aeruginosa]HCF0592384.1 hypothetical protein [Pseudomonas aeruginosa]
MSYEPTPEQLQQLQERLQKLCEGLGIVYRERADDPCHGGITITFTYGEEELVDQLIRNARKTFAYCGAEYWLSDTDPAAAQYRRAEQFSYQVSKCLIVSHKYWSVTFTLCSPGEKYSLLESCQ